MRTKVITSASPSIDTSKKTKRGEWQCVRLSYARSPMHAIPFELLSKIFLLTTDGTYDRNDAIKCSISLSHVCHQWRRVALMTGGLWTNITLTFPSSHSQLCRTLAWLSRSNQYPLDLLLDFRDPEWNWEEDTHKFRWQDMESVLRLLLPHVTRWRQFQLLTDTWAPIFTFLWHTRRVESAPALENVSISRCNAFFAAQGEIFRPTDMKTPISLFGGIALENLREVSLSGVHLDWAGSALQNLTKLELKYHSQDVMPSLEEFIDILAGCSGLQSLAIVGWGPLLDQTQEGVSGAATPLNLAKLQRSIKLPFVTHFSFGFLDVSYAIDLLSLLYLPSMEEFVLEDVSATLDSTNSQSADPILEYMTATHSLKCLSITHSSACCATLSLPLSQIRSLEFNRIRASEISLIRFLRQLDSLESLSLCGCDNALFALRSSCSPRLQELSRMQPHLVCPNLAELECRSVDARALLSCVATRRKYHSVVPLKHVCLDLQDGVDFQVLGEARDALWEAGIRFVVNGE